MCLRPRELIFWIALVIAPACLSEDICPLLKEHQGFAPSAAPEAYASLDSLGKMLGTPTKIRLFPSSSVLVSKRAAAQLCGDFGNERWIFYDESYLNSLPPTARNFVLAHEAAHHLTGDSLNGNSWTKEMELVADRSATVWLVRLGVARDQVLQAFEALAFPLESVGGYPTRSERRASVVEGIAAGQPLPTPSVVSAPRSTNEPTTYEGPTTKPTETESATPPSQLGYRGYPLQLVGPNNLLEVQVWPLTEFDADHLRIRWKNTGIEQLERLDDISGVEVKQRSLKPYTGGTVIKLGVRIGGPKDSKVYELSLTVRRGAKSIVYRFVSDSVVCEAGAACLEGLDGGERVRELAARIQSVINIRKASASSRRKS